MEGSGACYTDAVRHNAQGAGADENKGEGHVSQSVMLDESGALVNGANTYRNAQLSGVRVAARDGGIVHDSGFVDEQRQDCKTPGCHCHCHTFIGCVVKNPVACSGEEEESYESVSPQHPQCSACGGSLRAIKFKGVVQCHCFNGCIGHVEPGGDDWPSKGERGHSIQRICGVGATVSSCADTYMRIGATAAGGVLSPHAGSACEDSVSAGKVGVCGISGRASTPTFNARGITLHSTESVEFGALTGRGAGMLNIEASSTPHRNINYNEGAHGIFPLYGEAGKCIGARLRSPTCEDKWHWARMECYYDGDVSAGFPNGVGMLSGPKLRYNGSFVNGLPHGTGKALWRDDDGREVMYTGEWARGYFHGEGMLYVRGCRELGACCDVSPSGDLARDDYRGRCPLQPIRGDKSYVGCFVQGMMSGEGRLTFDRGDAVEGGFLNGTPHGKVVISLRDNTVFSGVCENGAFPYPGTVRYPNGDTYEGGFSESGGLLPWCDGQGSLTFLGGGQLDCVWKQNVLHGEGVYTAVNGLKSRRMYSWGVLKSVVPICGSLGVSTSSEARKQPDVKAVAVKDDSHRFRSEGSAQKSHVSRSVPSTTQLHDILHCLPTSRFAGSSV
ncbi:putative MORN repeat [Trypanosoma vivax]|uniref:MORN repeat-containing protein n=1 Tax=Trypanosoma vivax (strain Y486) TaxID=1055687 RepID=G0TT97_TRYVY|nr:hypothetical protein TRVL_08817 [Trypanosoma vivax]KAH8605835.1 putative MORN repeat [Trypanosoma vivax]CCC47178.1 conserved hypothetical protein [Trypanosoma vivax Y486]